MTILRTSRPSLDKGQPISEPESSPRRSPALAPRRRLRFGLTGLLLLMLVASVAAAAASYLVRVRPGAGPLTGVLFVFAAPACLLVLVSALRQLAVRRARRNRRRAC